MPNFEQLWFNKASVFRQQADDEVGKALRAAGWKHTSQTPGSVWMWQREIDGRIYSVALDDAARIQELFDRKAYFKQFPDELSD